MKKIIFVVIAILFSIGSSGCIKSEDPWGIAAYWYCDELDFILDATGKPSELVWKNEQYEVVWGYMPGDKYDVFIENGDGAVYQEEILFRGSWEIRKGNLVLEIIEDRLFEGKYDELVFEPLDS